MTKRDDYQEAVQGRCFRASSENRSGLKWAGWGGLGWGGLGGVGRGGGVGWRGVGLLQSLSKSVRGLIEALPRPY